MRTIWRLCSRRHAATALRGDGARLFGGRWNLKGTPMVYCSSTLALAMLEVLVHAPTLPADFVAIRVDLPPSVTIDRCPARALPAGWQTTPAPSTLARFGTDWSIGSTSVALEVPSAIIEIETNILLNPVHPDMSKLVVHRPVPMPFDARLK